MADTKLTGLTEISTLAIDDQLYIVDKSDTTDDAAGSSRRVQVDRIGGFINPAICQGRLTLETGVPVSTTDQTAKTSVFFTPYNGNRISVYDGTRWELYTFTERTLALGTLTSGKNYDVFIYDNSGTLTLELSAAWTNDTTRADALTTQDGIFVKSGSTTRRYLGTIRTTSTTTTEDSIGGVTTQVGGKGFVWNMYNRQRRPLKVIDTTDSWTYGTATFRQMNNVTGNKVEFVSGITDTTLDANAMSSPFIDTSGDACQVAVGIDSTTTPMGLFQQGYISGATGVVACSGRYIGYPGIGYHFVAALERASAGTVTFFGDNAGEQQSGLLAWVDR